MFCPTLFYVFFKLKAHLFFPIFAEKIGVNKDFQI